MLGFPAAARRLSAFLAPMRFSFPRGIPQCEFRVLSSPIPEAAARTKRAAAGGACHFVLPRGARVKKNR